MTDGREAPSKWIRRWVGLVAASGHVLDLACGGGRHARWLLRRGHRVTLVDRDLTRVADLRSEPAATLLEADLEAGTWPLAGRTFDGVVVTNYLWRPRLAEVVAAVAPGGALLYETFAVGNEGLGRPKNPDFLLRPLELIEAVAGELSVVAYEHGVAKGGRAVVQRIAAVRAERGSLDAADDADRASP